MKCLFVMPMTRCPQDKGTLVRLTFHVSSLNLVKVDTLWVNYKQMIRLPPGFVGDHLEYDVRGHIRV
jgi:hypothetical protein